MNKEVMLSCPEGLQPSFTHVKCSREVQYNSNGKPVYREVWLGQDSSGRWNRTQKRVECIGKGGIRSSPGCPALPILCGVLELHLSLYCQGRWASLLGLCGGNDGEGEVWLQGWEGKGRQ